MSSFNFTKYLEQPLSAHTAAGGHFTVERLTNGLTNYTVRTTFSRPVSEIATPTSGAGAGKLTGLSLTSIILKQAPPHIAWDPTRPLSVSRQLVEKRACEILAGADPEFPTLHMRLAGGAAGRVRVPQLIWHDAVENVLWLEDLGRMAPLSEVLLALTEDTAKGEEKEVLRAVAADLGTYLATLFSATANPPESFVQYMREVSDRTGIYDYLADVVLSYLRGAGMEDAAALSERVRTGFNESDDAEPPKCLGMVDFWPENVLVDLKYADATTKTRCGLVDWEYFGVSDASSELGMFLAHLHVHILNSATSPLAKRRIQDFTHSWLKAYVEAQPQDATADTTWKPSNGFTRRLLLSHGRDLVRGVKLYDAKLDDGSKARLLEGGARSLRAAGQAGDKIDMSFLKPSEGNVGSQADVTDIWEGLSILLSV